MSYKKKANLIFFLKLVFAFAIIFGAAFYAFASIKSVGDAKFEICGVAGCIKVSEYAIYNNGQCVVANGGVDVVCGVYQLHETR